MRRPLLIKIEKYSRLVILIIRGHWDRSLTHKTLSVGAVKDLVCELKMLLQEIVLFLNEAQKAATVLASTLLILSFYWLVWKAEKIAFQIILKNEQLSLICALAFLFWLFKHKGKKI